MIGTSPLLLLKALEVARAGGVVVVIEKAAEPGGSWTTARVGGHDRVETACHLLEAHVEAYRTLAASGVPLIEPNPPPEVRLAPLFRFSYGSPFLPVFYLATLPAVAVKRLVRTVRAGPGCRREATRAALADLRRRPARYIAEAWSRMHSHTRVLYLDGGAGAMTSVLIDQLRLAGGSIERGEVTELRLSPGEPPVVVVDGRPVTVGQVVASAALDANVLVDGRPWPLHALRRGHAHVLLALDPGAVRPVSYAHFPISELVVRVTDVTSSARLLSGPRRQMLLVQVRTDDAGGRASVEDVLAFLRRHRLLYHTAPVVHATEWFEFTSVDAGTELRRLARDVAPRGFCFLDSYGDLTKTIDAARRDGTLTA